MADWTGPQGYEVSAGKWGVAVANYRDDSSGATTLTLEEAVTLGTILIKAGMHVLDKRVEERN